MLATESLEGSSLLWVDDEPANNEYERAALRALGVSVITSRTTDDALVKLRSNDYDVIISDMSRNGSRAGLDILEAKQRVGDSTPLIVYSRSVSASDCENVHATGAFDCTNRPHELFRLLRTALVNA
ncbi:response regulator [Haladaptatus sp. NG-SE-30]